MATKFGE